MITTVGVELSLITWWAFQQVSRDLQAPRFVNIGCNRLTKFKQIVNDIAQRSRITIFVDDVLGIQPAQPRPEPVLLLYPVRQVAR